MAKAEVNFEMDERLWWQVRKYAQNRGMSIGEMTIKALGQYMLDHPLVLPARSATGASVASQPTPQRSAMPTLAGQELTEPSTTPTESINLSRWEKSWQTSAQ